MAERGLANDLAKDSEDQACHEPDLCRDRSHAAQRLGHPLTGPLVLLYRWPPMILCLIILSHPPALRLPLLPWVLGHSVISSFPMPPWALDAECPVLDVQSPVSGLRSSSLGR